MNTMAREMCKTDLGVVNLVVLACVLRATTKKRSSTFSGKKSAPPSVKSNNFAAGTPQA